MDTELHNPTFKRRGYIQVYYGDGKSKTCASMGQALRALGKNWKVLVMQFVKGGEREKYGEYLGFNALKPELRKNLKYKNCGLDKVVYRANLTDEDRLEAAKGWWYVLHNYKEYDMLILDEINIAIDLGIVELEKVIEFLNNKPKRLEVILTGRNARPEILELAHLVTEMKPEKHYWNIGVSSREGIEW